MPKPSKDTMKVIRPVYPLSLHPYENFMPPTQNEDYIQRMNRVVEYVNELGSLNNKTIRQWNEVMKWVLENGLEQMVSIEMKAYIDSGVFDEIVKDALESIESDITSFKEEINENINQIELSLSQFIESMNATLSNYVTNSRLSEEIEPIKLSLADLKSGFINAKYHNVKGDGTTDDSTAIQTLLNTYQGRTIYFPKGKYILTKSIYIPPLTFIQGEGSGYNFDHSTMFLLKGEGRKEYKSTITNTLQINNPSKGQPYLADSGIRGDVFKTLDLTSFSAGFVARKGVTIQNVAVIPYFDGVEGYKGTDGRLSDDWDVGIWSKNADRLTLNNVVVQGHYRKSALLITSESESVDIPSSELAHFENCMFQGFRGVAIRNNNADTGSTNYGFAGTDFINCYIKSLDHQSRHLATSQFLSVPFGSPSACLEMDGSVIRGIQFTDCTFMGRDDLNVVSHYASETMFIGCYHEAKSIKINDQWVNPTVGSRFLATDQTKAMRHVGGSLYAVDLSPYYRKEPTADRYTLTGVFNPLTCQHDEHTYPMFATSAGMKLANPQTAFKIWDANFNEWWKWTISDMVTGATTFSLKRKVADAEKYIMRVYESGNTEFQGGEITFPSLVRPLTDNTQNLGASMVRWGTVFAGTGSINTSDERHKQQILPIDDTVLDAWGDVDYVQYKFNDSVESKGEDARVHIGVIAQQIEQVFNDHGLNAFDYGILCYDEWEDQTEIIDGEEVVTIPSGNIYSIRTSECNMLESAYQRRELKRLKEGLSNG